VGPEGPALYARPCVDAIAERAGGVQSRRRRFVKTRLAVLVLCAATLRGPVARAYRLNVVAATELRLDPAVPSGSTALTVRAHLRDDRGAALEGRALTLTLVPEGGAERAVEARTNEQGDAAVTVDVGRARRVAVTGAWAGDSTAASARASIDVNFDAPFVTPELLLPGDGVTLGDGALEAVITVRVGEVQTLSPARLAVQLARVIEGAQGPLALASGVTDGAGRAALLVPIARFDRPGVARLIPRVDLGNGRVVEGVGRELLVRGRVAVSLLRAEGAEEGDGVTLHGAVVLSTGAAVPNAALRIVQGERTLAATRADAQGGFRLALGPEVLTDPGMSARAVFEPTEPWYLAAESPEVQLTAPPTPPIHWSWGAAPLALAALAVGVMSLRRRVAQPSPPPDPPPPLEDHVAVVTDGPARPRSLRVVAIDRATGAKVPGCRLRVDDGTWQAVGAEPVAVGEGATACQLTLEADGYAPRRLRMDLPRGGEVRVQVAMRTWREELFARIRPWLERGRRAEVLPTPRELSQSGALAHVVPLAKLVERGCYGPETPGPGELDAADALADSAREGAPAPRLDRR
jgi:hypothetical protein